MVSTPESAESFVPAPTWIRVTDYLVGSVLGFWVLARSPAPDTVLRHYVEGLLASLDGWGPKRGDARLRDRAPGKPRGAHR
jgi:hypothetical protein